MNVYVESNFVLEQALEQEQAESCEELVRLAAAGAINLLVPAFSLAEPHIALMRKQSERNRLSTELQQHVSELGRSRAFRASSGTFSELAGLLIRSTEREREGLERAMEAILNAAQVIPLDSDVFRQASGIQTTLDLPVQDSIVLASIYFHLVKTKPDKNCFLNRNTKDFDDPNVREILDEFGCKFFGRFDDGLRFVEASLRK